MGFDSALFGCHLFMQKFCDAYYLFKLNSIMYLIVLPNIRVVFRSLNFHRTIKSSNTREKGFLIILSLCYHGVHPMMATAFTWCCAFWGSQLPNIVYRKSCDRPTELIGHPKKCYSCNPYALRLHWPAWAILDAINKRKSVYRGLLIIGKRKCSVVLLPYILL